MVTCSQPRPDIVYQTKKEMLEDKQMYLVGSMARVEEEERNYLLYMGDSGETTWEPVVGVNLKSSLRTTEVKYPFVLSDEEAIAKFIKVIDQMVPGETLEHRLSEILGSYVSTCDEHCDDLEKFGETYDYHISSIDGSLVEQWHKRGIALGII